MGWASGSRLAEAVWQAVRVEIPEDRHKEVALKIVNLFEKFDCDTIHETETLSVAAGLSHDEEYWPPTDE